MKARAILRREWFGGLLVQAGAGCPTILEHAAYARAREELTSSSAPGEAVRLVDAEQLGYPLRRDALSTPGAIYLEITKRCNGACTHCYASATPGGAPDELTFAEWERVFGRLADGGAYYVRLTGGEPTLREDLPDLLDLIAEHGMAAALNTHGRFDEKTLLRLLEHGVRDLRLSVDGTEAIHDAIRGPGAFRAVLTTLRRIADYNRAAAAPADPTMNVVLMKSTRHCIPPLMSLAAELQCKISFGLLRPAGRASRDLMLSPAEVVQAAREVEVRRKELGLKEGQARINFDIFCDTSARSAVPQPFPFDNSKCPIGTMGVGISATGRLMPCNYLGCMEGDYWLGESVREHDILDLWQTSRVLAPARLVRRNSCADCAYYRTRCNGGCPATAYALTGDPDGRDPYCVRDVPLDPAPGSGAAEAKGAVSSLLGAIRDLSVYSQAQWSEYIESFLPGSRNVAGASVAPASDGPDLASRIERGEGARPVAVDYGVSPKIIRPEDLARLKDQQGLILGVVSGAYDLLHLGHVRSFRHARERLGIRPRAALCALTLSDEAIRNKKGPARPVLNLNERLALLAAVRWIDYVVPLDQADCLRALEVLQPEYFFKAAEDLAQYTVRLETDLVTRHAGVIEYLPARAPDGIGTTNLLQEIQLGSPKIIPDSIPKNSNLTTDGIAQRIALKYENIENGSAKSSPRLEGRRESEKQC